MSHADELVAGYILRTYREEKPGEHLATCTETVVQDADAQDGSYGCPTGCPYYSLDATLTCPHGFTEEFHYGDFGEISSIIEDMEAEERQRQETNERLRQNEEALNALLRRQTEHGQ